MSRRHWLLLLIILLVGWAARIWALPELPAGFFVDEASAGYDAYALLLTGHDQYGAPWPVFVRSVGDYDEALYRYLIIPFIPIVGLNELAVRLPAAIIGFLTLAVVYQLGWRWHSRSAALGSMLLAVSPWHVHFSRIGFRAILLPFLFSLGLLAFERGLRRPYWLVLAGLIWGISLGTYSSARVFVPLFVGAVGVIYWRTLWRHKWAALPGLGCFVAFVGLLAPFWLSVEGMARANYTRAPDPGTMLLNYVRYYSPVYLLWRGSPNPVLTVVGAGQLYWFEGLTLLVGVVVIWQQFPSQRRRLLIVWLLLYCIPAALTEPYHPLRSIVGVVLFALVSGVGLAALWMRWRLRPLLLAVMVINIAYFGYIYSQLYGLRSSQQWQYGMREAMQATTNGSFSQVFVSDKLFLPHMFLLFYTQYPPAAYQQSPITTLSQGNWFYTDVTIGRYSVVSVRKLLEQHPERLQDALVMVVAEDYPLYDSYGCEIIHHIQALDGTAVLRLYSCPSD
ncbi:MAG: glycosyltransferase family 39 protein [Chloroflexi bacterium]|nr:glycosyltransferase family 39 protein [Chloroflexota bacterium]MCI0576117.1 glycosyltransferase family 39 protein [Chloroflexota bacterium]MCI0647905.1 glycosyltransferase family 39 protein [Chloroflexota bacterium]MCI0727156.1 glycosyltransferase family 39 protein [Chloroflexota bacterium]